MCWCWILCVSSTIGRKDLARPPEGDRMAVARAAFARTTPGIGRTRPASFNDAVASGDRRLAQPDEAIGRDSSRAVYRYDEEQRAPQDVILETGGTEVGIRDCRH